jgi:hypothetical protein
MSGNRANASAIQRRTNASSSQFQPQPQQPVRGQRPGIQKQGIQQQQQKQLQQKQVRPKISISDAIALTTLRLGRVESFINTLPPLDQLGNDSLQEKGLGSSIPENMRLVDEAVFTSIVSRLEKLETVNNGQKQINQKFQGSLNVLSRSLETIKADLLLIKKTQEEMKTMTEYFSSQPIEDSNNDTTINPEINEENEQELNNELNTDVINDTTINQEINNDVINDTTINQEINNDVITDTTNEKTIKEENSSNIQLEIQEKPLVKKNVKKN